MSSAAHRRLVRITEKDTRQKREVDHICGDMKVVGDKFMEKQKKDTDAGADL